MISCLTIQRGIKMKNDKTAHILDSLPNIVIVTDGTHLLNVNKLF